MYLYTMLMLAFMDVVVREEKIVVHITIQGKRSPPRSFKAWFVFNVTCSTLQIVGPNLQHIMLWAPCQHLTSWSETLRKHWYAVFLLCRLLLSYQGLLWSCSGYYQHLPAFSLVLWKIKAIWNHSSYKFLFKFLLKRCSKVQRDFIPCHSTCTKYKY